MTPPVSEEDARRLIQSLDPDMLDHVLETGETGGLGNGTLGLPDELLTVERSPSLRVRRLSTGQMETKSGSPYSLTTFDDGFGWIKTPRFLSC